MALGLLILRVVAGLTLAAHGTQKLLGWFGGHGLGGTAGFFEQLGFRSAALMALLAAMSETAGVLFALGLLTPLAALALAVVMLNAIRTVHYRKGFFSADGGFEFPLLVLAVVVGVAAIGPGAWSLDRAFGIDGDLSGTWWGVGVFVVALVVSLITTELFKNRSRAQTV